MGLASLLVHPNAAQLVWTIAIGLTFIAFIPIEERQLLRARGDEYRAYMRVTRYRVFRGVW
jgi:protein-S-isoprenylcysteine O-methyltransferase Ste14